MANFKGHVFGAILFFAIIIWFFALLAMPNLTLAQWLMCTISGALFPDIDIKSKGQQLFYGLLLFILLLIVLNGSYKFAILISLVSFLPFISVHRGIFHNFWFLLFLIISVNAILSHIMPEYRNEILINSCFFTLGIISHLILDMGFKKAFKF